MSHFVREANSQKWAGQSYDEDSFTLTIADMDLPLYEPLKKKIVQRIASINNFTYKNPSQEYYQNIIDWYRQRHIKEPKIQISQDDISVSPSLLNAIYLLVQEYTKPGEGVLIFTPVFYNYVKIVQFLKRKVVETRLFNDKVGNSSRYEINFTDFEEKAKQAKVVVFCNPHNPTGRLWSKKEVERIVEICKANKLLLISDEILMDLTPQRNLSRSYSLINTTYDQAVICNSISKAFNSQSLKGGYVIFKSQALRNRYNEMINQLNLYTNEFALICSEIFYSKEGEKWLIYSSDIIKQNYDYLLSKIEGSQLVVSQLDSAYIIVANFEGYLKYIERWYNAQKQKEVPAAKMVSYFLSKQNIRGIEVPYASHYNGIFAEIRLTIGIEPHFFRKFVDKLMASLMEVEYKFREINAKL